LVVGKNANIFGNINASGNLIVTYDSNIYGNLVVGQGANIYGKINAYSDINAQGTIISNLILLNNKPVLSDPNTDFLNYNNKTVLTVDDNNILNVGSFIIHDFTNLIDVLLQVDGNISCSSIYVTSNVNKKKNIREITETEINELSKIKSYNFDLKSNNTNNFGFLAHEVSNVYPMLSNGETVNYIGFIPILLAKIKILENEINIIKKKFNV